MPTGIVIPVDEDEPIFRKEFGPFTDYQEAIGGVFQAIDFEEPSGGTLFVDEEGKLKHLPINRRATLLLWMHHPAFRGHDAICGNAVLIGAPDEAGDTTDAPQALDDLLFDTLSYRVEVQTVDDKEAWNTNQARYDNWVDAYNAGLGLAQRWFAVERVRVVPA